MSFFKVECMHGCGQVCLLVTLLSVDLRPHLALFPASNQICPPAEMETFGPVCFCNFFFSLTVTKWCFCFMFVSWAFFSQCQSQTPTRNKHLVRAKISIDLFGHPHFIYIFRLDSPFCQTFLTVLYNTCFEKFVDPLCAAFLEVLCVTYCYQCYG